MPLVNPQYNLMLSKTSLGVKDLHLSIHEPPILLERTNPIFPVCRRPRPPSVQNVPLYHLHHLHVERPRPPLPRRDVFYSRAALSTAHNKGPLLTAQTSQESGGHVPRYTDRQIRVGVLTTRPDAEAHAE